jgi:hypothetical protein
MGDVGVILPIALLVIAYDRAIVLLRLLEDKHIPEIAQHNFSAYNISCLPKRSSPRQASLQ